MPQNYIREGFISPDLDEQCVYLLVDGEGECEANIAGMDFYFEAGQTVRLDLEDPHLWSPEDPFLYELYLRLGEDHVQSYFAMRKFSIEEDGLGVNRFFLNGKPYFINGVLDPGIWPDGLYTPPCDEAMIYDIEIAKSMGFNALRREEKLDPPVSTTTVTHGYACLAETCLREAKNLVLGREVSLFTGVHFKDRHMGASEGKLFGRQSFEDELTDSVLYLHHFPVLPPGLFLMRKGQFDSTRLMNKLRAGFLEIIIPLAVGTTRDTARLEVFIFTMMNMSLRRTKPKGADSLGVRRLLCLIEAMS